MGMFTEEQLEQLREVVHVEVLKLLRSYWKAHYPGVDVPVITAEGLREVIKTAQAGVVKAINETGERK